MQLFCVFNCFVYSTVLYCNCFVYSLRICRGCSGTLLGLLRPLLLGAALCTPAGTCFHPASSFAGCNQQGGAPCTPPCTRVAAHAGYGYHGYRAHMMAWPAPFLQAPSHSYECCIHTSVASFIQAVEVEHGGRLGLALSALTHGHGILCVRTVRGTCKRPRSARSPARHAGAPTPAALQARVPYAPPVGGAKCRPPVSSDTLHGMAWHSCCPRANCTSSCPPTLPYWPTPDHHHCAHGAGPLADAPPPPPAALAS